MSFGFSGLRKNQLENLITRLESFAFQYPRLLFLAAEAALICCRFRDQSVRPINQKKVLAEAAQVSYRSRAMSWAHRYLQAIVWDHPMWVPEKNIQIMARYLCIQFSESEKAHQGQKIDNIKDSVSMIYIYTLSHQFTIAAYSSTLEYGIYCLKILGVDSKLKWSWQRKKIVREISSILARLSKSEHYQVIKDPLITSDSRMIFDLLIRMHEASIRCGEKKHGRKSSIELSVTQAL